MKRPTIHDDYVRRRAAEIILPQIKSWAGSDYRDSEESNWIKSLASVAREHADGYEMAQDLERRHGWAVNAELVEILGGLWVTRAIEELTDQWVRCLGIRPRFEIGERVICSRRPCPGTVTRIDGKLAQYGVRYPDMKENSWCVVNFEDCTETPVLIEESA